MEKRWCSACGEAFQPRAQTPGQTYCSKETCQRSRKRLWQKTKRKTDHDYHENQAQAQATWRGKNLDYWRQYRETHPTYTENNRREQKARNARRRDDAIAKSDASRRWLPPDGVFVLTHIGASSSRAPQQWMVRLTLIA